MSLFLNHVHLNRTPMFIGKLTISAIPIASVLHKGNSSIPLFETHKSIEKIQTKTKGNASNIKQ